MCCWEANNWTWYRVKGQLYFLLITFSWCIYILCVCLCERMVVSACFTGLILYTQKQFSTCPHFIEGEMQTTSLSRPLCPETPNAVGNPKLPICPSHHWKMILTHKSYLFTFSLHSNQNLQFSIFFRKKQIISSLLSLWLNSGVCGFCLFLTFHIGAPHLCSHRLRQNFSFLLLCK